MVTFLLKMIRWLGYAALSVVGILLVYVLLALFLGFLHTQEATETIDNESIAIYLISNGIHTDCLLPIQHSKVNWPDFFPADSRNWFDGSAYVAFGWGDRGFYIDTPEWKDLRSATAFKALFGLSRTAMHLSLYSSAPKEDPYCQKLLVSPQQYLRLVEHIQGSFQLDSLDCPQIIPKASYGSRDAFYEAKGRYSLWRTCNEWVREGLQAMQIRTPLWSPFDKAIFYHIREWKKMALSQI
jgi:uncharacterized protein (TIGR02117 family)